MSSLTSQMMMMDFTDFKSFYMIPVTVLVKKARVKIEAR